MYLTYFIKISFNNFKYLLKTSKLLFKYIISLHSYILAKQRLPFILSLDFFHQVLYLFSFNFDLFASYYVLYPIRSFPIVNFWLLIC
jgi:hypothetical protein